MKLRNRLCCILMSLLFLCAPVHAADNRIVAGEDLTPDFSAFLPEINKYASRTYHNTPLTVEDIDTSQGFPIYLGPNFFKHGLEKPEKFSAALDRAVLYWYQPVTRSEEQTLQIVLGADHRSAEAWEQFLPISVLRDRLF